MIYMHGVHGRTAAGSLDDLSCLSPVSATARTRRLMPVGEGPDEPARQGHAGGPGPRAAAAYGGQAGERHREPLTRVADVMSRPAVVVLATATVAEAWQVLVRQRIGQAPVMSADGALVGLVGRAELLPIEALARTAADAPAWQARLAQPVATVMWSPVPGLLPDTDLRRAAALLLATGLPGVPVTDEAGQLLGFVSRSDLLRAMVADPPLDLWG